MPAVSCRRAQQSWFASSFKSKRGGNCQVLETSDIIATETNEVAPLQSLTVLHPIMGLTWHIIQEGLKERGRNSKHFILYSK